MVQPILTCQNAKNCNVSAVQNVYYVRFGLEDLGENIQSKLHLFMIYMLHVSPETSEVRMKCI
jgi:hypothetical protein